MKKTNRPSIWEPGVLLLGIALSIVSAAICMQIMGQFGIAPNTSLIGAVLIMIVARIPVHVAKLFRNLERQNYVLSIASSAGFSAANCGFVAIATVFIMGKSEQIMPVAFGALIGSMISIYTMGRLFDSTIFPAKGAWPTGVAAAKVLEAGDAGGKKSFHLVQGLIVGVVASIFGIPAAGVGIAFIANMVSMGALAVGMILRGHSTFFFRGFDIGQSNIAQGIMIGAGVVALVQIFVAISSGMSGKKEHVSHTVSDEEAKSSIIGSAALFVIGAIAFALVTGIFSEMGLVQSVMWVAFSGFTAIVVMALVGTAVMHSGWAPAFAVVTICLTIGLLLGFPPVPLAVLTGYIGSVGLPLADTGNGLKTGWLIRGQNTDNEYEAYGRKQQVIIKQIGAVIGIGMALLFGMTLVNSDVVPPMSIFYAQTVAEAAHPALLRELVLWVIPGAILQAAFGNKSVGLMLASGLLINNPIFGITVLAAIVARLIFGTKHMEIRGPGLIAGDGLFGFVVNIFRAFT